MLINVLDHGSVELVESWGSDEGIIAAARVSTQKGFLGWGDAQVPGDERLLRFLWTKQHLTPFEMAGATFSVTLPFFVIREWQRHRTQGFSEASARYGPIPDLHFLPTVERCLAGGDQKNKQAGSVGGKVPSARDAEAWLADVDALYRDIEGVYQDGLALGIPKEIARIVLPMGRYTKMTVTANLRNWLAFLALRQAPDAQLEIRAYADAVCTILADRFPRTVVLFKEDM